MTFSPLPTTLEAAKAEILSLRETYNQSAAELRRLDAEVKMLRKALAEFHEKTLPVTMAELKQASQAMRDIKWSDHEPN